MKKLGTSTIIIIVVVAILFFWGKGAYNGLVSGEEKVTAAWAQVENVYQRRADLIPNLVATVKGYAEHEKETLQAVVDARANATGIKVENLTEEELAKFQQAQEQLSSALGRLIAVSEAYPDLKANQNFLELQSQLEGTENRIAVERNKFNETAREYNTAVRSFPKNIFASIFGFSTKGYFTAAPGAETAPKVEF
ncbi:MAG: LemA family protein [Bacteroidales bacterium]|nr:LemA family protein [Bacteroidales bacterium]